MSEPRRVVETGREVIDPSLHCVAWHGMAWHGSAAVVFGGLCIAYCERCAYEDLAKQFERMRIVFRNGDRELKKHLDNNDVERAQKVIEELGNEAIIEHSQWLILRRARPLQVPIG